MEECLLSEKSVARQTVVKLIRVKKHIKYCVIVTHSGATVTRKACTKYYIYIYICSCEEFLLSSSVFQCFSDNGCGVMYCTSIKPEWSLFSAYGTDKLKFSYPFRCFERSSLNEHLLYRSTRYGLAESSISAEDTEMARAVLPTFFIVISAIRMISVQKCPMGERRADGRTKNALQSSLSSYIEVSYGGEEVYLSLVAC